MMTRPVVSAYTLTLGRELYLQRLLESVIRGAIGVTVEHHLCFQGVEPSEATMSLLEHHSVEGLRFVVHRWDENVGNALGQDRILRELEGDLIARFDDDAQLLGPGFFRKLVAAHRLMPGAVLHAFPVGLVRTVGGMPALERVLAYDDALDLWFTYRRVELVGGLARSGPGDLLRTFRFLDDRGIGHSGNETRQFADQCEAAGVAMYILENGLVAEHQETSMGQFARLGRAYFATTNEEAHEPRGWRRAARRVLPPVLFDATKAARRRLAMRDREAQSQPRRVGS